MKSFKYSNSFKILLLVQILKGLSKTKEAKKNILHIEIRVESRKEHVQTFKYV